MGLPQPLHGEAERATLYLGIEHAPHCIPLGRPEMQQALVVLTRSRKLCLGEVEHHGTIFKHDRAGRPAQEILDGSR
jgi:hypothetical protein